MPAPRKFEEKWSRSKKRTDPRQSNQTSHIYHTRKYGVMSEHDNTDSGPKLDQMLRGDAICAKKDLDHRLTGRGQQNFGVVAIGGIPRKKNYQGRKGTNIWDGSVCSYGFRSHPECVFQGSGDTAVLSTTGNE